MNGFRRGLAGRDHGINVDANVVKGSTVVCGIEIVILLELDLEIGCVINSSVRNHCIEIKRLVRKITFQRSQTMPGLAVVADRNPIAIVMTGKRSGHRAVLVADRIVIECQFDATAAFEIKMENGFVERVSVPGRIHLHAAVNGLDASLVGRMVFPALLGCRKPAVEVLEIGIRIERGWNDLIREAGE